MKVIVLDGNENQAVAAVRSLAASKHSVVVGSDASWSKAGWSRAVHSTFVYPSPQYAVDTFVDCIIKEVSKEQGTLILPMTERTTLPLSLRRDDILRGGGLLVLPSHEQILRAFDKEQTTQLAKELGINVPGTFLIENRSQAESYAKTATFPLVLKPKSSEEISVDGRVVATGSPGYARDSSEFLSLYDAMSSRCSKVLAQEYVAGVGTGYFALMREGELIAEFAHRRIRDVRPTGSGSALRESIEIDPQIRTASLAMLHALQWHGVAMVEFRQRADGSPVFLEVNGRFWNSLALAIYAGIDFPTLVAQLALCGDAVPPKGYRKGVRCRWLLGDVRHVVEVWKGKPKSYPGTFPKRLRTLFDFVIPRRSTYHDNFKTLDPLPELGDWLHFLFRTVPSSWRKRRTSADRLHAQSRYSLP
jgi:predicted ATP-grasp superfamily ATP-dependent carboligase